MGGGFEDGESGALRVGHDGDAADVFEVGRRHVQRGAELPGFGGRGVAIGNGEVGEPMSRGCRLAVRGGRNAADKLFTVLNVPVVVGGSSSSFMMCQPKSAE